MSSSSSSFSTLSVRHRPAAGVSFIDEPVSSPGPPAPPVQGCVSAAAPPAPPAPHLPNFEELLSTLGPPAPRIRTAPRVPPPAPPAPDIDDLLAFLDSPVPRLDLHPFPTSRTPPLAPPVPGVPGVSGVPLAPPAPSAPPPQRFEGFDDLIAALEDNPHQPAKRLCRHRAMPPAPRVDDLDDLFAAIDDTPPQQPAKRLRRSFPPLVTVPIAHVISPSVGTTRYDTSPLTFSLPRPDWQHDDVIDVDSLPDRLSHSRAHRIKLKLSRASRRRPSPAATANADIVVLVSSDEDDDGPAAPASQGAATACEDVAIVSHVVRGARSALSPAPSPAPKDACGAAEDLVVVGVRRGLRALIDLPHMRFQCGQVPYRKGLLHENCQRCYCFVCDTPVAECHSWSIHCRATDQGDFWKRLREKARKTRKELQRRKELEEREERARPGGMERIMMGKRDSTLVRVPERTYLGL